MASTYLKLSMVMAGLGLIGCGGTSTAGVGAGDGGPADGAMDGTSTAEAANEAATGVDAPSFDVVQPETGTPEAGDDGGCTGTGMACRTCCRMGHGAGYKTLVTAELACACKPSVCGPLEAGSGDAGDASDLGVGACATTCGGTMLPDATCTKCLTDATGSMGAPGECYTPVSTACEADTDCVAYVTCLGGCK